MADVVISGFDNPLVTNRENINTDDNPDLVKQYNVRSIPTMILVDENGAEIKRLTGAINSDVFYKFINTYL